MKARVSRSKLVRFHRVTEFAEESTNQNVVRGILTRGYRLECFLADKNRHELEPTVSRCLKLFEGETTRVEFSAASCTLQITHIGGFLSLLSGELVDNCWPPTMDRLSHCRSNHRTLF